MLKGIIPSAAGGQRRFAIAPLLSPAALGTAVAALGSSAAGEMAPTVGHLTFRNHPFFQPHLTTTTTAVATTICCAFLPHQTKTAGFIFGTNHHHHHHFHHHQQRKLLFSSAPQPTVGMSSSANGTNNNNKNDNHNNNGNGERRDVAEVEEEEEERLYEKAINQLNALQSNAQTLALAAQRRPALKMDETRELLDILGITLDDIDRLNVVHITGTKGKGSTAAFLESILRSFGYKTGFYSSPHLVHVRERIRIDGRPIPKRMFTRQFFRVYDAIFARKKEVPLMPAYFKFLTLLAFQIFCDERVDVAIVEVGIGGEYDCTNVIRRPIVCAINTLDLDHTKLLGTTLPEIAWNKAGIAKPGAVMLSVAQPDDAMHVIEQRCAERTCPLFIVPPLDTYRWPSAGPYQQPFQLGIAGPHQHINASLALQLARVWLAKCHGRQIGDNDDDLQHQNGIENLIMMGNNSKRDTAADDNNKSPPPPPTGVLSCADVRNDAQKGQQQQPPAADGADIAQTQQQSNRLAPFSLTPCVAQALAQCRWDGRSQLLRQGPNVVYHLDGAHTPQSIKFCAQWFMQSIADTASSSAPAVSVLRILLFHCTGDRSSAQLLPHFKECRLDMALFCPALICSPGWPANWSSPVGGGPLRRRPHLDSTNVNMDMGAELRRCEHDQQIWHQIAPGKPSEVFSCVVDALDKVRTLAANNNSSSKNANDGGGAGVPTTTELHVLVTGSLLLVGDVLAVLDPTKADE